MDGFCLQGELDLTLFYKIEGYFDNLKSIMTGNGRIHEYMYPYTPWGSLLVMSKLPKFVLGRYRIVLNVRYLFLGII